MSLCSFNGKSIFKFGGCLNKLLEINNYIEKYDMVHNKWTILDPKFDLENPLII